MTKTMFKKYAIGFILSLALLAVVVAPVTALELDTDLNQLQSAAALPDEPLPTYIGNIISVILGVLGIIMVVLILYAGFLWMTDAGKGDNITKAKDIIRAAIIGLILIVAAYAITQFVINAITNAVGNS